MADGRLKIYLNRDESYDAIRGNKLLHFYWNRLTYKIYGIKLITIGPNYIPTGKLVGKPHIQMILQVQRSFDGNNESIMNFNRFVNESIRDKMTPKTEEDVENTIKDYLPHQLVELGYKNKMWHLVKRGIEQGASVHMNNDAALRFACEDGNLEIVKYLIDKGANIHEFENDALVRACYSGNLEVVKCLVDNGGNIHDGGIEKVLRAACSSGHPDIVEYLLSIGAKSGYITSSNVTRGDNCTKILKLLNKHDK